MFSKAGYPIDVEFKCLMQHCYLFTGGLIGVLSAFFVELAEQAEARGPGAVTFAHCAAAVARVESAGHPNWPAFERNEVTPVELHQAHAYVLEIAEMAKQKTT